MDSGWQSTVDRTLRSTEATLEQLQHRRVSYDRAKRKVDDYLGASPVQGGSPPALDMMDHDVNVPPPLPPHLRYRAARMTGPSPPTQTAVGYTTPLRRTHLRPSIAGTSGGGGGEEERAALVDAALSSSPLQLVNAQVRGALLELELEKAKRADSVRELSYRTAAELAEMRSLITQLQTENGALRRSVRALEGRLGYVSDAEAPTRAIANGGAGDGSTYLSSSAAMARPPRPGVVTTSAMGSGLGPALPDATTPVAVLVARMEAAEAALARLQQQADDRQTRQATVLRDLVKAEVHADMSQVRALARDAARDSAEELLKLRLSALQSSLQSDIQKALRTAVASETVAQHAQEQCRESGQSLSARLHTLQGQVAEWQRAHSTAAASIGSGSAMTAAASVAGQHAQERLSAMEHKVEELAGGLQAKVQQCRADVAALTERCMQQHKALAGAMQSKAEAAELLVVRDRLDEQQRRGGGSAWVSRDDVVALLQAQLQPVQDELRRGLAATQEANDSADAWRRQTAMRLAAMEASRKEAHVESAQQDQQWQSCTREVQQVRADVSGISSRIAEAVRQVKAELTEVWEAKTLLLEERAQQVHRERQLGTDAQLRQQQQTLADQQEALQRARTSAESADERLRRTEAALSALEVTVPRAVAEVRDKCEALQAVVQQTCVLPLTRVQQDVEAVQRRLQSVEEDRSRLGAGWTQQLAEAKQYHDERARLTREMLEQRLAHHKEMYEELRAQQSQQRRAAEEQHQQLLDRLRQTQAQAQTQQPRESSVASAPPMAREAPPAEAERSPVQTQAAAAAEEHHQRDLQLLASRLEELHGRLGTVEAACSSVRQTVTEAAASLTTRVADLQDRTDAAADDWRRRHDQLEHDTAQQLSALSQRCAEAEASADTSSARAARQLEAALAPLQLVSHLAADEACLQHLALRLREHLAMPPDNAGALLAEAQTRLAAHAASLEALRASLHETQREVTALQEERVANAAAHTAAAAAAVARLEAEVSRVADDLRDGGERARAQHASMEAKLQLLAVEPLTTLAVEVAALKPVVGNLPIELTRLSDQYTALHDAQRQQLPTLQRYVQDIMEVVESNQAALLDPLQLRLRAAEDRHKGLQSRLEESTAAHEAAAAERAQVWLQRAEQQQAQLHDTFVGHLEDVRGAVVAAQADVDAVSRRVAAAEAAQAETTAAVTALQAAPATAAPSMPESALVGAAAEESAPLPVAESDAAAAADLRAYVEDVDERLTQLEDQASDAVTVTAEMLGAFRDQLQHVVGTFAAAAAAELAGRTAAGTTAADAVTTTPTAAAEPPIESLADVFLFLLHQLHELQQALRQLQSNTVDTLEILEQHEESVAPLPLLQHTVEVMAAALAPLAERLGVDAGAFRAIRAEQEQQHGHSRNAALFPPPHSSGSSGGSDDSGVGGDDSGVGGGGSSEVQRGGWARE
ncbi:hypothetical protein NESM_000516900 [Novymonas esmeraldas]|uniref:Uncharacterized protein n=1 Tax=Novymonas esmeraldas TaxID=1808958 RepID=A0AAW0EQ77_9TRYP